MYGLLLLAGYQIREKNSSSKGRHTFFFQSKSSDKTKKFKKFPLKNPKPFILLSKPGIMGSKEPQIGRREVCTTPSSTLVADSSLLCWRRRTAPFLPPTPAELVQMKESNDFPFLLGVSQKSESFEYTYCLGPGLVSVYPR